MEATPLVALVPWRLPPCASPLTIVAIESKVTKIPEKESGVSTKYFQRSIRFRLGVAGVLATAIAAGVYAHQTPTAMAAHASGPGNGRGLVDEQPFLAGNDAAMQKMMVGMSVKPTGNVDKDFVDMMVPHHQGAIDMAVLELRYGTSVRLKALAQEIVVTQQQEIAAMKLAVGEPIPPSHASPVSPSETPTHSNQ